MHSRLFLVAVAFLSVVPGPALAQSDLEVLAAWQQYAAPGATVSFAFLVTNRGPQPDPAVTFFARPEFAYDVYDVYDQGWMLETLGVLLPGGDVEPDCGSDLSDPTPWAFESDHGCCRITQEYCESNPGLWSALHVRCDLGSLAVDETAAVTVSLPLVTDPPPEPALVFHEPADLGAFTLLAEDPSRGFMPAEFGESVYFGSPVTGDLMLCHDRTAGPDRCCGWLIGDYTGKIALAERGDCDWVNKVMNAQQAGAVGAIVFNRYPFDDPSYGGYVRMPDNLLGGFTHIPAVFIPQEAGHVLLAALQAGPVSLTMGPTYPSPWLFDVTGFTYEETDDPDLTDNEVTCEVWVGSGQVPVASFSVSPESPIAHRETHLTDTSTWNPTAWAWDFGDGQASTNQNPTHAWAEAGTYTVSLTAANAAGSDTVTRDVVVGEPVLDVPYLIPAAARVHGLEGSFFLTDVEVNNRGAGLASYRFRWLPRDSDNSTATSSEPLNLGPGMSARYVDVVGSLFALDGAAGALAVDTDSADIMVTSRTYNRTATGGTLGQSIPGLRPDRLIQTGQRLRILQLVECDAFRSNLGLANGTASTVEVELALFDTAGATLGTRTVTLRPWDNTQLVRVLADHAPVEGYADVWSDTPGAAFAAYGSVVDNQTNDPTTVLPE